MLSVSLRRRWLWLKFLLLLVVLAASVAVMFFFVWNNTVSDNKSSDIVKKVPQPKTITSNVLFMGTTFWGRYMDDWSKASTLGIAYPFSRLNEFDRNTYDAWIAGLECPLANGVTMTSAEMEQELQFNCSPEYLPEAAKWFTVFTLANNHTDNHGVEGFVQTKANLESYGIQYFGSYDYLNTTDVCEVISLPVTVKNDDESTHKASLPVAMCGYHGVFGIPIDEAVAEIEKYSPYMPVIAMPHMGAEYQASADEIRTNLYRKMIDAGADMVIGDHPHWIQNTESYNGHLIVYSMGNFMFDQQYYAEVTRSAMINVLLTTEDTDSAMLKKWLQIGPVCKAFKDDCLAQIIQNNLTKLQINYGFGVVGSFDDDRITRPSTPEQLEGIIQRLNWRTTLQQLQAPYSSL